MTVPLPPRVIANRGEALKVAITEAFFVNVTLQLPTPLQAPDHPAKKELTIGAEVSVISVPSTKLALHV